MARTRARTGEQAAAEIIAKVATDERWLLDDSDSYGTGPLADFVADFVESILSGLSSAGFYVVHESTAPSWMLKAGEHPEHGTLYRVAGPDEDL